MKVYIYRDELEYYDEFVGHVYCYVDTHTPSKNETLIQTIEAEPTNLPITTNWKGLGVEIGEVFAVADADLTLIRTA
jgi:hypothetical protein